MGFNDLIEQTETTSASSDESSTDETEYVERPYVRMSPTSTIGGEVIDLYYTGKVFNNGDVIEQPNGDFGVVLRNPTVLLGSIYANGLREDADLARKADRGPNDASFDYKVVNEDDDTFSASYDQDQNIKSIEAGANARSFDSSPVDAFDEDEVVVFLSNASGDMMGKTLDVHGAESAFVTDEGENSRGLMEFPLDWGEGSDNYPRVSRYPQLREDVEGEEIFVCLAWRSEVEEGYDGPGYWSIIGFNDFEGDAIEEATRISPVRNREDAEYESTLAWHDDPSDTAEADENETEQSEDVPDFTSTDEDGMSEQETQFIEGALNHLDSDEAVRDAWPDFEKLVQRNIENGVLPEGADPEELEDAIESERAQTVTA